MLITTDTLIEGVHFDLGYMTLADVGYKALAVNMSDINAMGGECAAALGTLGVPKSATCEDVEALLDGMAAALQLCRHAGQQCELVGGDTVAAPQWMIGFTALGGVDGKPLLRSGGKPGDVVWHSGTLGLSGVGFEQLRRNGSTTTTAHARPAPPLSLGPWLQRRGYATAAQDISDSLSQVALQLADASGAGIELDFRGYGFAPEVVNYADEARLESVAQALLAQAEDYELLFTTPPEFREQIESSPVPCRPIGRLTEAGSSFFDEHGRRHELRASGFEHL